MSASSPHRRPGRSRTVRLLGVTGLLAVAAVPAAGQVTDPIALVAPDAPPDAATGARSLGTSVMRMDVSFRFRSGGSPRALLKLQKNQVRVVRDRHGALSLVAPRTGSLARVPVRGRGWHNVHIRVDAQRERLTVSVGRFRRAVRTPLLPETAVLVDAQAVPSDLSTVTIRPISSPLPARWAAPNPLAGALLWGRLNDPARGQVTAWRRSRPADAALISRIASQPRALWLGDWFADVRGVVAREVDAASRARATPVFVAYAIPQRDCGGHSAGGMAGPAQYGSWIGEIAAGIGSSPAVVILEPDALAQSACLPADVLQERLQMLSSAVDALGALPATSVYIDAGHSGWLPPSRMAVLLRDAGVERARGFSVNVAAARRDDEVQRFADELSRRLGGAHYVVDTGRNGTGPAPGNEWCNPRGLGLGRPPAATTDGGAMDARLWIKPPGESDGTCNGGPPAGQWWPEYALDIASRGVGAGG